MVSTRQARVNRDPDGEPLGISLAISADELRELGIDPDEADAVEYEIADGGLQLREAGKEVAVAR